MRCRDFRVGSFNYPIKFSIWFRFKFPQIFDLDPIWVSPKLEISRTSERAKLTRLGESEYRNWCLLARFLQVLQILHQIFFKPRKLNFAQLIFWSPTRGRINKSEENSEMSDSRKTTALMVGSPYPPIWKTEIGGTFLPFFWRRTFFWWEKNSTLLLEYPCMVQFWL